MRASYDRLRCDQARPVARTGPWSRRRCGAAEAPLLRPTGALFERLDAAPARCTGSVTSRQENALLSVPSSHGGGLGFAIYSACGTSAAGSLGQAPTSVVGPCALYRQFARRRRDIERSQPASGGVPTQPPTSPSLPSRRWAALVLASPGAAGGGRLGARGQGAASALDRAPEAGVPFCGRWAVCPLPAIGSRRQA